MSYISDVLLDNKLERPEYIGDIQRIREVCRKHNVILTLQQAERIWLLYSDSMAAGWMILPDSDDDLWNIIS